MQHGVTADGDRSVEATMRITVGFVSLCLYYPLAGIAAASYLPALTR